MSSSPAVRPARIEDAARMARVNVQAWQETYRGLMSDAVLDDPGFVAARERFWTAVLTDERYRANRAAVAERDGELVGIAMSGPPLEAGSAWARQLFVLYLLADHHGTGAGPELLEAVVNPGESVVLWVADPNPRAQAFYVKQGFVPEGTTQVEEGVRHVRMVRAGRARDEDVLAQLAEARGFRRVVLAGALGHSYGELGPAELRRLLEERGPGTSDLRCAALLALARRCRSDAHDDYALAFHSKDAGTREYAALALSAYGRDGLWEEVAHRFVKTAKRRDRRGSTPSDVVLLIIYLARHASYDPERLPTLVGLIRTHWAGLDPRGDDEAKRWIGSYWPEAAPRGPRPDAVPAPDTRAMEVWVRHGLLFAGPPPEW